MNIPLKWLGLFVISTVLAASPLVMAQAAAERVIDLEFPGGTLADYVKAVQKAAGDANIVVMPEARDLQMPYVELRQVSIGAALELMQGEFQPDNRSVIKIELEEIGPKTGPWKEGERPVYRVSARVHRPSRQTRTQAGVWSVADLLVAEMKAEDILTAVESAVELLAHAYEPAEIRFHEATGLIIARGHPEQMEAIEDVVDQLRGTIEMRREAEREGGEESLAGLFEWFEDMKRLENEAAREGGAEVIERAEARIHELRAMMAEHARTAEEFEIRRQAELREREGLHREVDRLRAELHQREAIIRDLERRLNERPQ